MSLDHGSDDKLDVKHFTTFSLHLGYKPYKSV